MSSADVQQKPTQEQQNKQNRQSWTEYGKEKYNQQYENWMPWIEDMYLRWFTKDNKTSYTAKENLDKTKVTGIKQVDTLQDGVNNLVAGQVGQGGLAQPIGDAFSKEGLNRAERQGKDDKGSYAPGPAGSVVNPIANSGKAAAGKIGDGASAAGGYVSGMLGGKKE